MLPHRDGHDHRARRTSFAVQRPYVHEGTIADHLFFIAGGIVSVMLGVTILVQGWQFGWGWYGAVLLVGWLITAYLTLPRLHRILTAIYVPNYFIGRARTSDGLLGDPVNVAVVGNESQLHRAMLDAGWTKADDITAQSTWRIVATTLTRRSYDEAPVSPLFLFGRRQDFAYQQEVDGNPGKRHHVRFWRCPDGWLLPGGRRVDWLAAGTYDRAVGFSLFTLQITHKIDENTDIERDHIVRTVTDARDDVRVTVIEDFSTGYHSRNGGGDSIITDGDLPVLDVRSLPLDPELESADRDESGAPILDSTGHDERPGEVAREIWKRRPLALVVGCALAVLSALIGVARFLWQLRNFDVIAELRLERIAASDLGLETDDDVVRAVWIVVIAVSAVIVLVQLVLALLAARGVAGARVMLMAVLLAASIGTLALSSAQVLGQVGLLIDLSTMLLLVAALLALSSTASREFVAARRYRRRAARILRRGR
ncbi:hypothetical protein F8O04_11810 [Pseudoclavibacter endophyticus]|uniref:Cyclic nucleotide-binding domain-containing protein n=2 Tax=Pseudoclavibacter endophyticus TaxID=1778590 RepID=A0A6H9WCQ2_9MICO|nr:hypothetical protein F8O04_11810 [Pseudoclavibacter endophyticus]